MDAVHKQQVRLKYEHHKTMEGIRVDAQELDIENTVKELELVSNTYIKLILLIGVCEFTPVWLYLNRNMKQ